MNQNLQAFIKLFKIKEKLRKFSMNYSALNPLGMF